MTPEAARLENVEQYVGDLEHAFQTPRGPDIDLGDAVYFHTVLKCVFKALAETNAADVRAAIQRHLDREAAL